MGKFSKCLKGESQYLKITVIENIEDYLLSSFIPVLYNKVIECQKLSTENKTRMK